MIRAWFRRQHPLGYSDKLRRHALAKSRIPAPCLPLFKKPYPSPNTPLADLKCVVLDFETSGLNPKVDEILSVGMIHLHYPVMSLSRAEHYYVESEQCIDSASAVVNHIVPETLLGGISRDELIECLVKNLKGKVVIAHGAEIEKQFLRHLLQLEETLPLPLIFLDTMRLERSLMKYRGVSYPDLRLAHIREQKGLPPYLAHNAFADVVATGELFLVLIEEIFADQTPVLGPLVMRSLS
ncbi:DNA polymerase III subunit epsilon [Vibrio sp. V27_P1S3P104]|uniref:3'-5' exonuclease n=1 Tax=Vibrio TaxID=662 RepID=UPI000C1696C0|nr:MULTISPECIES: exonuclease domain-containing protein [Vibrio]NAW70162.1 DNA polymerase III subunit epsilon [Vibrio sp. V28_P6S34P95]NAX05220.1 DNA polymerase III subunit epsilon [Vibrio sp. V30_P3S12P165]NAX35392.1 DNA polymerase III subunit epsilon [Vibrio sp. V29_P1S30P107]NAX37409.1 DNA polymerase III subunit epsilon [Vibrio sp. V27_P1S3P104]NAX39416.1 DNA polymerase III subunit epsilon [Vibrio sp. V26_P1S5P106]